METPIMDRIANNASKRDAPANISLINIHEKNIIKFLII
uniref:Uncharacterized protein n=1 Tax=viral metagenome TaxID=1070528 RepID=A0A6C0CSB0_9ZZZZ